MNPGNIAEHYLETAIIKKVRKVDKTVYNNIGIGTDYSLCGNILSSLGTGEEPYIAWTKGLNNFLCSGARPKGVVLTILLPLNSKESHIKKYMDEFGNLSEEFKIQITGGQTETRKDIINPFFNACFMGETDETKYSAKNICTGMDIVIAGYVGMLGNGRIIKEKEKKLSERFDRVYLSMASRLNDYSVLPTISALAGEDGLLNSNICFMHDASFGGIYSALWQLGKKADKGFLIDNRRIPIKQETIEVCEYFDINPYYIDSTGSLIIVCRKGYDICEMLNRKGIAAEVVGHITGEKERLVKVSESDIRTLSPVTGDDIYKILK